MRKERTIYFINCSIKDMKRIFSNSIMIIILWIIAILVLFKSSEKQVTSYLDEIDHRISHIEDSSNDYNTEKVNDKEYINELISENEQLLDKIQDMEKKINYLEERNIFLNNIFITTLREMNSINKDIDVAKIALNGINIVDAKEIKELTDEMQIVYEDEVYKHIIIANVNIIFDSNTGKMCKMYCENTGQLIIDRLTINIGDDYFDAVSKTSSYIDSTLTNYPYKFTGEFNINNEYQLKYYTIENKSDLSRPLITSIEIRSIYCD